MKKYELDLDKLRVENVTTSLKKIKEEFENIAREKKKLKQKIEKYNKEKEIKRLEDEIKQIKQSSLDILDEVEQKRVEKFVKKHKKCRPDKVFDTGAMWYCVGHNSVGHEITIKCPYCGKEEDITNIEAY